MHACVREYVPVLVNYSTTYVQISIHVYIHVYVRMHVRQRERERERYMHIPTYTHVYIIDIHIRPKARKFYLDVQCIAKLITAEL